MIAFAGLMRLSHGQKDSSLAMTIRPRWPLSELPKVS
jgi:N6-L-threonylcarbamoyladenine synthase